MTILLQQGPGLRLRSLPPETCRELPRFANLVEDRVRQAKAVEGPGFCYREWASQNSGLPDFLEVAKPFRHVSVTTLRDAASEYQTLYKGSCCKGFAGSGCRCGAGTGRIRSAGWCLRPAGRTP